LMFLIPQSPDELCNGVDDGRRDVLLHVCSGSIATEPFSIWGDHCPLLLRKRPNRRNAANDTKCHQEKSLMRPCRKAREQFASRKGLTLAFKASDPASISPAFGGGQSRSV